MNGAVPQSFFGWLDYDEEDARRMREVFAAFDDKGTVDSLGIGIIRDAIAEQLFPGISTIQTRARYFLFVPWIFKMIEAEQVAPAVFPDRLRALETALIESLCERHGPGEGVIGYRSRNRIVRLPSTVYWNGLGVFGIRTMSLSLSDYRQILPRLARQHIETDDDGEHLSRPRRVWDPGLPRAPEDFPFGPISLTMPAEESEYLVGRIVTRCPDSMLAELARDLSIPRDVPLPWEVPLHTASPQLQDAIGQARNFSELMHGAQLLYNLLLVRRAETRLVHDAGETATELEDEFEEWSALVAERRGPLADWIDGGALWPLAARVTTVPKPTRRFVQAWAELALRDPTAAWKSRAAETLIVDREACLKGRLARLVDQRALEGWRGEPLGAGQMAYRWGVARQILDDLEHHGG